MPNLRFAAKDIAMDGEVTVLEALEAEGVAVPSACRAGACRSCMMRAVAGEVPAAAQAGLSAGKRELGYFLSCVCRPTGDLEVVTVDAAAEVAATIVSVTATSGAVLIVRLRSDSPLSYRAGQFITLLREDGLARPYSLASVPALDGGRELVLHVRHHPEGAMSGWLATAAAVGARVRLRGPYGECFYVDGDDGGGRPLLLVGAGTGLAPLYGIVRDALHRGHAGPITLLHGARRAEELYHRAELAALTAAHPNLEVIASAQGFEGGGEGASAVVDTPLDRLALDRVAGVDARALRVFLCGAPAPVFGLRRSLFIAGVSMGSILADAFLPAVTAPSSA